MTHRTGYALVILAAAALAAAFGTTRAQTFDGTWTLVEVDGRRVQPAAGQQAPAFTIEGNTIKGFDGCNTFQGRLDRPGSITSTRRGCLPDVLRLPLDLADPRAHLAAARVEGQRLRLPARNGLPESVVTSTINRAQ